MKDTMRTHEKLVTHTIFFSGLCLGIFALVAYVAHAGILGEVRDLISSSEPAALSNHTVSFTVPNTIPPSGSITITPQPGAFFIPGSFDFRDVDFLVEESGGEFENRQLASSPSVSEDGVSVTSGSNGNIRITLNVIDDIPAGSRVRILLGTHASFQFSGSNAIQNPSVPGTYRIHIETRDDADALIDEGTTMIAITNLVTLGPADTMALLPERFNGHPTGQLGHGTTAVELSLNTNIEATCRFDTEPDTEYEDMANTFENTGNTVHTQFINGLEDGETYSFFVRCAIFQGLANEDDFVITFSVKETPPDHAEPGEPGGEDDVGPFPVAAGGGGEPFPPSAGSLEFSGWAYPGGSVTMLQDGSSVRQVTVNQQGEFSGMVSELSPGTYTFGFTATDGSGRTSQTLNNTVTIRPNARTSIDGIYFPPTIASAQTRFEPGDGLRFSGASIPGSEIELELYRGSGTARTFVQSVTTETGSGGAWELTMESAGLAIGTYQVRAQSSRSPIESSNFSRFVTFGVGTDPDEVPDGLPGDLNLDGQVNLVDFSILLFWWGTDGGTSFPPADINSDGTVGIADFSIMLFYWTG